MQGEVRKIATNKLVLATKRNGGSSLRFLEHLFLTKMPIKHEELFSVSYGRYLSSMSYSFLPRCHH